MRRNGEALTYTRITEKILRSLDPRFDYVVMAIKESKEMDKLIMDYLIGFLQAHKDKIIKRSGDKSIIKACLEIKIISKKRQIRTRKDFNKWIYH